MTNLTNFKNIFEFTPIFPKEIIPFKRGLFGNWVSWKVENDMNLTQ